MFAQIKIIVGAVVVTAGVVALATSTLIAFNGPYKRATDTAELRRGLLKSVLTSQQEELEMRLNAYVRRNDELYRLLEPDAVEATTMQAAKSQPSVAPQIAAAAQADPAMQVKPQNNDAQAKPPEVTAAASAEPPATAQAAKPQVETPPIGGPFAAVEEPAKKQAAAPEPARSRSVRPTARQAKPVARRPIRRIVRATARQATPPTTTLTGVQDFTFSNTNTVSNPMYANTNTLTNMNSAWGLTPAPAATARSSR